MSAPDHVASHETFVGMLVAWAHVPRGGYGYTVLVPAEITALSLDGTFAEIEVTTAAGRKLTRTVQNTSLRRRGQG